MATEQPIAWSRSRFREWHIGHWHAAKGIIYQVLHEDRGVRELVLPSLVPIDDWHAGKGYDALRESQAHLWHTEQGKTDIMMYHPAEERAG
jgi:hypothetical protein